MSPAASPLSSFFFFFNDTAPTEIYPLSLHDALPIWPPGRPPRTVPAIPSATLYTYLLQIGVRGYRKSGRSEEHTSELQSHLNLVCRLLLEKKKKTHTITATNLH